MACSLMIHVIPRAPKRRIISHGNGQIKVYVTSPPESGAANREVIRLLATLLDMPRTTITIASGASSRMKRIIIDANITYEEVLQRLGLAVQHALF